MGSVIHVKNGFKDQVFNEALSQSFARPSSEDCFDIDLQDNEEWGCFLGSNKPSVDYILFGDSHSLSIKSTIDKLAKEKKFKILFVAASACLPFRCLYK